MLSNIPLASDYHGNINIIMNYQKVRPINHRIGRQYSSNFLSAKSFTSCFVYSFTIAEFHVKIYKNWVTVVFQIQSFLGLTVLNTGCPKKHR